MHTVSGRIIITATVIIAYLICQEIIVRYWERRKIANAANFLRSLNLQIATIEGDLLAFRGLDDNGYIDSVGGIKSLGKFHGQLVAVENELYEAVPRLHYLESSAEYIQLQNTVTRLLQQVNRLKRNCLI